MSAVSPLVACWLDSNIGVTDAYPELKQRFSGVSERIEKWYYFDSGDEFNRFIDENPNITLVTIMSGHLAKTLVTAVSDRTSLHSVYIFCGNTEKYQSLLLNEHKVKGVFNFEDDLYRKMYSDLHQEFP
ncbi:unnamed protein product [Rotaria magnacalcarata]|uniref:Uncharacterized protein n=1 Tax=Rotaria magnacalcarata TaxID=392030 RepID=A0A819N3K8_9BILA|nr:unnamed protein product [Rotaria magnacalcarata]CAF3990671.1 unnamed protein product [Rotaria magnacalcarata]